MFPNQINLKKLIKQLTFKQENTSKKLTTNQKERKRKREEGKKSTYVMKVLIMFY